MAKAKKRNKKLVKEKTRLIHSLRDERPRRDRPRARRKQRGADEHKPNKYHLTERGTLKPRTSGLVGGGINILEPALAYR